MNEKKIKKLIEYRRVSTLKQKVKNTIKRQEILNKKFLEDKKGEYVVEKAFIDDGRSGFKSNEKERPEYHQMIQFLENNTEIYGVIVLEIDRLGRDSSEMMRFKDKAIELKKCVIESVSGMIYTFDTPMQEFIFENMSSLSSFIGKRLKNKLQFMRKIAQKEHPEKFGRPKKEIPEKLKEKMIHWYKIQNHGFKKISDLIKAEDLEEYPDWFQRKYPKGFGTPKKIENKEGEIIKEKKFYLSPATIGKRLKEWDVKIRKINDKEGFIYFLKSKNDLIKIGFSVDYPKRINDLQNSSPIELELLGIIIGTQKKEEMLHNRFKKYRSHGEWFYLNKDILKYIDQNNIELEKGSE